MVKFLYALLILPMIVIAILVFPIALIRFLMSGRHRGMDLQYLISQTVCIMIVKFLYRARVGGREHLPAEGGALLVSNHVSYADVLILTAVSPRPVRFMSWEGFERIPPLWFIMRWCKTIPVSPSRAKEAIRRACERIEGGEMVLIFPEGQLTRTGSLNEFRPGYEMISRKTGAPVYPVYMDGLWGSVFSYRNGGGPFRKLPPKFPRPVTIRFGARLESNDVHTARLALLDLGADAFPLRPELTRNLARATLDFAARNPGKDAIVDRAAGRTVLSFARAHALARVFSRRLAKLAPERRVGIILPPGIPGTVVNLACVMLGKTPVNLNYTLGRTALEECMASAEIRTVFTVGAFREKLSEKLDIPWPENTVDTLVELRRVSKVSVLVHELLVRLLPSDFTATLWRIPRQGGDTEASILFTSGSSGSPKGVILTHRNVLANATQIHESGIVPQNGCLLANLPTFHSFGHTVSIWFALTKGCRNVCLPSPLDTKRNLEVIAEERVNTLIGTPTFYRGYLKKSDLKATASLLRIIAGAEKTPAGFAEECEAKLGGQYFEGYGTTETSPVISVCVPDAHDSEGPGGMRVGRKPGSVGRLAVGQTIRIHHPTTGEPVGFNEPGILSLRGANVFAGYLNDPVRTAAALNEGWYSTGDIVRMDEEGFLFIEGRLSRFSKIGGEMVPHGVIEETVTRVLDLSVEVEITIAVAARTCPKKGEELILITTLELDPADLRRRLAEAGLANLWIPRRIHRVPAIPVLATGKLNLGELQKIAANLDDSSATSE